MRYKLLGKSGLKVSELCLGTMTFGEDWGWGGSREASQAMFDAFVNAGGNFIDTANIYTNGTSEKYTGELIASDRNNFVLATKYSLNLTPDNVNGGGNSRKSLVNSVERSLKSLNTDYIDLLWVHVWDFLSPVDEVMRALDDLVHQGKILYVGISDAPAWIVSQANTLADLRGWSPFVALQIEYSLAERTVERELIPMAHAFELAITPWSPLAGGLLSGKYNKPTENGEARRYDENEVNKERVAMAGEIVKIADELGVSASQVSLAWLLHQATPRVPVIPIIGGRKIEQIEDNLKSVDLKLSEDILARLNEISKVDLGFPHEFLKQEMPRRLTFGNYADKIDNGRNPRP